MAQLETPTNADNTNVNNTTTATTTATTKKDHDHPLQYKWTLWHGVSWENLNMVSSFQTVGEFWRLFNNLKPPSQFENGGNYQLFKGKVQPKWEDQYNAKGGAWRYKFADLKPNELNYVWYHSVLQMIGENFQNSEDICGLYLMMRSKKVNTGHIELWIKDGNDINKVKLLGEQFKKICCVTPKSKGGQQSKPPTIEFTKHSDAKEGVKKAGMTL
jgi:translation initiation factor 4E